MTATLFGDIDRGADLSPDGMYRYNLWRRWAEDGPSMAFVMLNPSTADAEIDDPTIRRCIRYARREGCSGLVVRNLFAFRTPFPKDLKSAFLAGVDVIGPDNDWWLGNLADHPFEVHPVVAAWGAMSGLNALHPRRGAVASILGRRLRRLDPSHPPAINTTEPHPLYRRDDNPLISITAES